MRLNIRNSNLPKNNSLILVCLPTDNVIGMVEQVKNNKITLLMLDRNGRIIIDTNSDWMLLDIDDMEMIRHSYDLFVKKDIADIVKNSYEVFRKNFLTHKI